MDKKKQQFVITGVLLTVMVVMLARALFFDKKRPGARKSPAASAQNADPQVMTANMAFLASVRQSEAARLQQEAEWQKPWGRDPFGLSESGGGVPGNPTNFNLSGIVWDEKMPVAILNDKLLQAGDLIDGCQVKEIFRSSVKLVCDGKSYELQLFKPGGSEETKEPQN